MLYIDTNNISKQTEILETHVLQLKHELNRLHSIPKNETEIRNQTLKLQQEADVKSKEPSRCSRHQKKDRSLFAIIFKQSKSACNKSELFERVRAVPDKEW